MGTVDSKALVSDYLDENTVRELAGDFFDKQLFDTLATDDVVGFACVNFRNKDPLLCHTLATVRMRANMHQRTRHRAACLQHTNILVYSTAGR